MHCRTVLNSFEVFLRSRFPLRDLSLEPEHKVMEGSITVSDGLEHRIISGKVAVRTYILYYQLPQPLDICWGIGFSV